MKAGTMFFIWSNHQEVLTNKTLRKETENIRRIGKRHPNQDQYTKIYFSDITWAAPPIGTKLRGQSIKRNEEVIFINQKIILLKQFIPRYSFWSFIFYSIIAFNLERQVWRKSKDASLLYFLQKKMINGPISSLKMTQLRFQLRFFFASLGLPDWNTALQLGGTRNRTSTIRKGFPKTENLRLQLFRLPDFIRNVAVSHGRKIWQKPLRGQQIWLERERTTFT